MENSLCFRCDYRARFLETGIGPRCECKEINIAVSGCYMYKPVKPVVLAKRNNDKRPQFAGYVSARSNFVRIADGKLKIKKFKDGSALYWDLSEKQKMRTFISASTKKIEKYNDLLPEFMNKIFGIKSFMVTDESSIYDFDVTIDKEVKHKTEKILAKIQKVYGVDVSKAKGLLLIHVLKKITLSH